MKKRRKIIWIIVVLAVVGFAIFWFVRERSPQFVLATENPKYGFIANTVTATGTIQPVDTVAVGTQVSGTISRVYVDFNSKVKKGQLLAELDKTILNAQVQQIMGTIDQAHSQQAYEQSNFNRQSELFKAGAISKADLETAQNAYKVADANVKSAQSQLQAAQKNLSLANIYSPIDGTVLSRNVSEGQTVASSFNTPTLFSLAKDLTQMQVRAAVDEADIGSIKSGQKATFTVDAFPDDVFSGTLLEVRLQPSVSSNVVTYTTIINAPNDDLKLKPGMTANIIVYTKTDSNALLVSARATKFKPDSTLTSKYNIEDPQRKGNGQQTSTGPGTADKAERKNHKNPADSLAHDSDAKRASVWLLNGTTITRKSIRIGMEDGTQVQVLSGLAPGDQVVDGVQQITAKASKNAAQKSPFMPARRGGGNNRPTGGGSGAATKPSR